MIRKSFVLAVLAVFALTCVGMAQQPPMPPAPSVKLLTPTVGEIWALNSTRTVSWQMMGAETSVPDSIHITFASAGKEIQLMALYKANPLMWDWQQVGPESKLATMTVTVFYGKNFIKDSHDFAISGTPPPTPMIKATMKYPNGGEGMMVGATKLLKWTLTPAADAPMPSVISLWLSRDAGKTYAEKIVADLGHATTQYKWIVTGPAANKCRIKVVLNSSPTGYVMCEDASDKDFGILTTVEKPHHDTPQH